MSNVAPNGDVSMRADVNVMWDRELVAGLLREILTFVIEGPLGPPDGGSGLIVTALRPDSSGAWQGEWGESSGSIDRVEEQLASGDITYIGLGLGVANPPWRFTIFEHGIADRSSNMGTLQLVADPASLGLQSDVAADGVTDFLACVCGWLSVTSGGAVDDMIHEYGSYARAAGADSFEVRYDGKWLLDYCLQVVVPPKAAEKISIAELEQASEMLVSVAWPDGEEGYVARYADESRSVSKDDWRHWREVLSPALPPSDGRAKVLPERPIHILEEDWVAMSAEEVRRRLKL